MYSFKRIYCVQEIYCLCSFCFIFYIQVATSDQSQISILIKLKKIKKYEKMSFEHVMSEYMI